MTDTQDLLERLRKIEPAGGDEGTTRYFRNPDGPEAADEIESQAARIAVLERALEDCAEDLMHWLECEKYLVSDGYNMDGTAKIYAAARSALASKEQADAE